jgi:hypothetical protein
VRRRRQNPISFGDVQSVLVLAVVGVGAYLLYKGFSGIKKAVCSVTLPSWAGGSGESLLCETTNPDGTTTPSALNTPATLFDASGNVVPAPAPGSSSAVDTYATDPYTTFGGLGCSCRRSKRRGLR